MKVRVGLVILLLIGSIALLYLALNHSDHLTKDDVLLNIGSSVLQLVATVGFIDILMERQKRNDESQEIAWKVLHDIDAVIWVWLGGSRHFDINELVGLLEKVKDHDLPTPLTENGLISLGARADNTLRVHPKHMKRSPKLQRGLRELVSLAAIRDEAERAASGALPRTPTAIAARLLQAVRLVASTVDLQPTPLAGVSYSPDSAFTRQLFRERGEPHE